MFGRVFFAFLNDPPSSIEVEPDALGIGQHATIQGVTGEVIEVVVSEHAVQVALGEARFALASDDRVTLHLDPPTDGREDDQKGELL